MQLNFTPIYIAGFILENQVSRLKEGLLSDRKELLSDRKELLSDRKELLSIRKEFSFSTSNLFWRVGNSIINEISFPEKGDSIKI